MFKYKYQIFIITFLTYSSIHSLRTTYSFSKATLAQTIQVNQSQLGLVDSLMIYALALGFLQQTFYPSEKPVRTIIIGLLLTALCFLLIPLLIPITKSFTLLCIIMVLDGYCQSFVWPNILMLINSQFDNKKQSFQLGIWSTNTNVGNIIGFIVCQYLVLKNELPWQLSMYFISIFILTNCIFNYFFVQQILSQPQKLLIVDSESDIKSTNSQITDLQIKKSRQNQGIIKLLKNPQVILMTLVFSLVKSIQYGILFWVCFLLYQLPIYFDLRGLFDYSAYIPITFDSASIISSILLGYIFKFISNKGLLIAPLIASLLIFFTLLKLVDSNVAGYFVLIALVGLCLGGTYNALSSLVAIQIVKFVPFQDRSKLLGIYSSILMCAANIITGTTQILIGEVIGKNEQLIFTIFFWYSLLTLIMLLIVGWLQRNKQDFKDSYIQIMERK